MAKTGESNTSSNTPVVAGLHDWYPRGKSVSVKPAEMQTEFVSLSCSASGTLTLAIKQPDSIARLPERESVSLRLLQRKVEPIAFQKYSFKLETATDLVFGRDTTGKNLRIDAAAFDEKRVSVKINGVDDLNAQLDTTAPNRIKLSSVQQPNTVVTVVVAAEKDTIERTLDFTLHDVQTSSDVFGAWDNVRYIKEISADGTDGIDSWWIYSCRNLSSISNSTSLQVVSVLDKNGTQIISGAQLADVRFLLASTPYSNVDRYFNFIVETEQLANGFLLSSPISPIPQLQVSRDTVTELFPPLRVLPPSNNNYLDSSFISNDKINTSTSSAIVNDTGVKRLSGTKIIGPL